MFVYFCRGLCCMGWLLTPGLWRFYLLIWGLKMCLSGWFIRKSQDSLPDLRVKGVVLFLLQGQ